jgi:PHD/YefM family antitoxin component YafN of YafNO toxin-antitoxin module
MISVHPQYITDAAGKKLVVLPLKEFDSIMEELEDQEDVRLYDEAKKEDDGSRISLSEYLEKRKLKK